MNRRIATVTVTFLGLVAGLLGVAAPAQARPAGPLELTVHAAPNDNNGGSWAWSSNGNVIRAAQPSVAYRELRDFGTGYWHELPDGSSASNYTRVLRLSGVVEGRFVYAGSGGGPVPVVRGKGVVRVAQPDVDRYVKVVLESSNGSVRAFYVQQMS